MRHITFNCPFAVGREIDYIRQAIDNMHLSGDGPFTKKCQAWLEARVGCSKALLTHSCTGALEMAAMLADIQPGDEVIITVNPSKTNNPLGIVRKITTADGRLIVDRFMPQ